MKFNFLFFLLIFGILFPSSLVSAQEQDVLSGEGRGHFKAAMVLFEMASSTSDYEQVAAEFEKVVASDPDYADTYINLCKIYGRIGVQKGDTYFTKAEEYLETYHRLQPDDSEAYQDELIILEALKDKYKKDLFDDFVGIWELFQGDLEIKRVNEKWMVDYSRNTNSAGKSVSVLGITQEEDYLILSTLWHTDGKKNGKLSDNRYWIHHKDRNIHYTEYKEYEKYKIWKEDGVIYVSLISSDDSYYYYGRHVHSDPPWHNSAWNSSSFKHPLKRKY